MQSKYGVFGYLDEDGAAVLAGILTDETDEDNVFVKDRRVSRMAWADSRWGQALLQKKSFPANELFAFSLTREKIARSLIVPIVFQDELIGFIGVANKSEDYLRQECEMLENIARYIAPLLDARLKKDRQEKKRRLAEDKLRDLTRKLSIKVKVMKCLRAISELLQNPRLSEDEIFQGVVDLIPSGWQYPEITCARIALKGKEFQTANYQETPWKISSPIKMDQEVHGILGGLLFAGKTRGRRRPFPAGRTRFARRHKRAIGSVHRSTNKSNANWPRPTGWRRSVNWRRASPTKSTHPRNSSAIIPAS